jgi:hypothetical protein
MNVNDFESMIAALLTCGTMFLLTFVLGMIAIYQHRKSMKPTMILIDRNPNPIFGELWNIYDPNKEPGQYHLLAVQNGTLINGKPKIYQMIVPTEIDNAIDACKWTYPSCRGMTRQEFIEMSMSRT